MSYRYKSEDLANAPMFAVFGPIKARLKPGEKRGVSWDLFEVEGTVASSAVEAITKRMSVKFLDLCPMIFNELPKEAGGGLDAAVWALESGFWLIKLPDKPKSPYYRFYVVTRIGTWKTPFPGVTRGGSAGGGNGT
jgi:hypothetical protein